MAVSTDPRSVADLKVELDGEGEGTDRERSGAPPGRRRRFPSAFTVLTAVTIAVWVLAFVVPTGQYSTDEETCRPIPGSYEQIEVDLSINDRLYDLLLAPVKGLYGVESIDTRSAERRVGKECASKSSTQWAA